MSWDYDSKNKILLYIYDWKDGTGTTKTYSMYQRNEIDPDTSFKNNDAYIKRMQRKFGTNY